MDIIGFFLDTVLNSKILTLMVCIVNLKQACIFFFLAPDNPCLILTEP